MTSHDSFISTLAPVFSDYMALKQALGRRYANERRILQSLDAFLTGLSDDAPRLTEATFALWCKTLQHLSATVRRNSMRVVRNLCLYWRRRDPNCFVPDLELFPRPHQPVRPYIFADAEIVQLLDATRTLQVTATWPLRPAAFRLAIVLLYTAGLRRGELFPETAL